MGHFPSPCFLPSPLSCSLFPVQLGTMVRKSALGPSRNCPSSRASGHTQQDVVAQDTMCCYLIAGVGGTILGGLGVAVPKGGVKAFAQGK